MDVEFFFELLRNVLPKDFRKNQTSESHTDHDPKAADKISRAFNVFSERMPQSIRYPRPRIVLMMSGEILRRRRLT